MKKIYIVVLLLVTSFLVSCGNVTTENTTENTTAIQSTALTNLTEISLEQELNRLSSLIPKELTEDYYLPQSEKINVDVRYYQDEIYLEDNIFKYTASIEGVDSLLRIELIYEDVTINDSFIIRLIENETQYNQDLITNTFLSINSELENQIPDVIDSDFLLPQLDVSGAYITYQVDISEIYNGYYVYPAPETDEILKLSVSIIYQAVSQNFDYYIRIKALNLLDRIPEIRINTNQSQTVTSKEEYVYGDFSLVTYNENQEQITLFTDSNMRIKARGNSTFFMPKLSYRIKLGSKTNLLFDYNENDWVLLANFSDQTLIRNHLANSLSENMNMEFTPSSAFVNVYINDEYMGNYTLTDQIEVTNDRVNIEEKSTDLDTGYLIEFDKRMLDPALVEGVQGWDFFILYGIPYVIKSPKTDGEYFSQEQFYYIEDYFHSTINVLMNGYDYSEYIDEKSFIDWFIINELFQNVDSGYSSVYFYKDKGGLLKMGPIWDFDLSSGNPGHLSDDLRKPEGWYTSLPYKNIWYNYLMNYDSFKENLKDRWNELYAFQIQDLLDSIYPVAASITRSRYMNFQKWNIIGIWEDWYTATEVLAADTYQKQLEFLYYFLRTRSEWLNEAINEF